MDITRVRTPEVPEEKDGNGKITKERIAEEKITIQAVGVWDTVGRLQLLYLDPNHSLVHAVDTG